MTYDGATLRLYVNGVQTASQARTGSDRDQHQSSAHRRQQPVRASSSKGLIDEVRVYNRALSQTEIQADMNTAVSP